MPDTLTQADIDGLLNISGIFASPSFKDLKEFETFLSSPLRISQENSIGMFTQEASVLSFFKDKNEKILHEIKKKNAATGIGNIKIPGTQILLINYSLCPDCGKIYSFQDLFNYFSRPKPNPLFKNKAEQYKNDTTVCCSQCNTYFLPALIVEDKIPVSECQFLCRAQTVNAIEIYYSQNYSRKVLTQLPENIIHVKQKKAILNDIALYELKENPALILNLIQYTPLNLILNLAYSKNKENKDYLFGMLLD